MILIFVLNIFIFWKDIFNVPYKFEQSIHPLVYSDDKDYPYKLRCSSSKFNDLVSGQFLYCRHNAPSGTFEKVTLWTKNYNTNLENETELNVTQITIHITQPGNTDYFIHFYSEKDFANPDYIVHLNEQVVTYSDYAQNRFYKLTIIMALITLIFIIPAGMKSLKDLSV